jgi:hypothetical protein
MNEPQVKALADCFLQTLSPDLVGCALWQVQVFAVCSEMVDQDRRVSQAKIRAAEGQLKNAAAQPEYGITVLKVQCCRIVFCMHCDVLHIATDCARIDSNFV